MADSKSSTYARQATTFQPGGNISLYSNQYSGTGKGGQGYGMPPTSDISSLAHSFQGISIQNPSFATQAKHAMMSNAAGFNGVPSQAALPYNAATPYMYPTTYNHNPNQHAGMYTPHAQHYVQPLGYLGYQQHDNSPLSQDWTPTTAGTNGDVPTLITPRRAGSVSSNENDQPATPAGGYGYASYSNGVLAVHRSPSSAFQHGTPSPSMSMSAYNIHMPKQQEQSELSPRLKMLINQEPPIPPAIPAPSSPLKPLDRALENQRGETNVYIRGLLPETSDGMLEQWGSRFGDIKSSKSIIDMNTGLCKGFGFVKYHSYEDAENCIRGFHHLGYEVSFARESFYSKLKTFADEGNTNLYVSNLPKTMNEHELGQLFAPHKVCSSRILRDRSGNGRGVGFARFESRDSCEEVIQSFNNHTIPGNGEDLQIQIRYADTQEQKSLKQQTQAARQFRSAEYEYATQAWRTSRDTAPCVSQPSATELEKYLGTSASIPIQGQRWAQSAMRSGTLNSATHSSSPSSAPVVQINVQPGIEVQSAKPKDSTTDTKPSTVAANQVISKGLSPVDSANEAE